VLLVDIDPQRRAAYSVALQAEGIPVSTAGSFAEARALFRAIPPDVLITQIRLAEYNGMHLAHWGRMRAPTLRSVVLGGTDPLLEWEARIAGFLFVHHDDEQAVVQAAHEALDREVPRRCWNRKQLVPQVSAHVDGYDALIVDIGYGGFRAQLTTETSAEAPRRLVVEIPSLGVEREAECRWVQVLPTGKSVYGACVGHADTSLGSRWRLVVDALPNASLRPE
jgi:CheY-like chemotaxis protein